MRKQILYFLRCLSLGSFSDQFCEKKKIKINKVIGIKGEKTSSIYKINLEMKNLFSEVGIFLIS